MAETRLIQNNIAARHVSSQGGEPGIGPSGGSSVTLVDPDGGPNSGDFAF